MDNQTILHISDEDKKKLEEFLGNHDFPVYVDYDEIELFFDNFKLVYWEVSNLDEKHKCSFCDEFASHINNSVEMYACEECMADIENKEIDLVNPEDHSISLKLRSVVDEWANKNYYEIIDGESYFHDYDVKHNQCSICHELFHDSENESIAVPSGANMVAHVNCVETIGFKDYYNDSDILDFVDVEKMISQLDDNPKYTFAISLDDAEKIDNLLQSLGFMNIPCPEIDNLFKYIHIEYWTPINRKEGCSFCRYQCVYYNKYLDLLACHACLDDIEKKNISPILSNSMIGRSMQNQCSVRLFIRHEIVKWADKNYYVNVSLEQLNNIGIKYDRCRHCQKYLLKSDDIIISPGHISHLSCMKEKGSYYAFRTVAIDQFIIRRGLDIF